MKLEKVDCSRGAPMGRRSAPILQAERRSIRLFRVALDGGGYDSGGAYWGLGESLYCAQDEGGKRQFVRAADRMKAALALGIPIPALKVGEPLWMFQAENMLEGDASLPQGVTHTKLVEWVRKSLKGSKSSLMKTKLEEMVNEIPT